MRSAESALPKPPESPIARRGETRRRGRASATLLTLAILGASCATSPTGRKQLQLLPEDEMRSMGVTAFQQVKQSTPESSDPELNRLVRCVSDALIEAIPPDLQHGEKSWEVVVFEDPQANAFALPGGKIGVNTGLFKVAKTPDQLATVLGHEVSHVLAGHGNERVSSQLATETGLSLISALMATNDPEKAETRKLILGLIGVGAQVGILLPFSRTHESEADALGLDLMARAGFDPKEAIQLWKNMEQAGGDQPPQFLSTHPSHETRIRDLSARMSKSEPLYLEAKKEGHQPHCSSEAPVASSGGRFSAGDGARRPRRPREGRAPRRPARARWCSRSRRPPSPR